LNSGADSSWIEPSFVVPILRKFACRLWENRVRLHSRIYSHEFSDSRIKSEGEEEGENWPYPQAASRSWIINPIPWSTFDCARFKGMKDAKREMRGRYDRTPTLFYENVEIYPLVCTVLSEEATLFSRKLSLKYTATRKICRI